MTPPTTPAPALEATGIVKRYGSTVALDEVAITVAPGELLALVGPSGCGKSTFLRVVAGLTEADRGSVRLAGTLVDDGGHHVPPERRRIGLVFQDHALFPHLTVGDNVAFGVKQDRRSVVTEMLAMVGLAGYAERYPHELSGGERQRVALARALAPRPTLLLLDEPFASLDPNLRAQVRHDVVAVLRRTATPAVFVTHDQQEALAIGDRIAVLRAGRVEQLATPWEVFHQPVNRFVASFMGEASFLPVDTTALDLGALPDAPTGSLAMVRPDDLVVSADPAGTAEVTDVEFRGSAWCYTVRLGDHGAVLVSTSHLEHLAPGDRVRVAMAPGHRPVIVPGP